LKILNSLFLVICLSASAGVYQDGREVNPIVTESELNTASNGLMIAMNNKDVVISNAFDTTVLASSNALDSTILAASNTLEASLGSLSNSVPALANPLNQYTGTNYFVPTGGFPDSYKDLLYLRSAVYLDGVIVGDVDQSGGLFSYPGLWGCSSVAPTLETAPIFPIQFPVGLVLGSDAAWLEGSLVHQGKQVVGSGLYVYYFFDTNNADYIVSNATSKIVITAPGIDFSNLTAFVVNNVDILGTLTSISNSLTRLQTNVITFAGSGLTNYPAGWIYRASTMQLEQVVCQTWGGTSVADIVYAYTNDPITWITAAQDVVASPSLSAPVFSVLLPAEISLSLVITQQTTLTNASYSLKGLSSW